MQIIAIFAYPESCARSRSILVGYTQDWMSLLVDFVLVENACFMTLHGCKICSCRLCVTVYCIISKNFIRMQNTIFDCWKFCCTRQTIPVQVRN